MVAIGAIHNGLVTDQAPQITAVALKGPADGYDYDVIEVKWSAHGMRNSAYQFSEGPPSGTYFSVAATGVPPVYSDGASFTSAFSLGLFRYANIDKIWLFQSPRNSAISLDLQGSYFDFTSDYVPVVDPGGGSTEHVPTGSGFHLMYECVFGDGTNMQQIVSNQYDPTDLVFPHSYERAGTYQIQVNQYYWTSTVGGAGGTNVLYAYDQAVITVSENLNFVLAMRVLGKSTQFL